MNISGDAVEEGGHIWSTGYVVRDIGIDEPKAFRWDLVIGIWLEEDVIEYECLTFEVRDSIPQELFNVH